MCFDAYGSKIQLCHAVLSVFAQLFFYWVAEGKGTVTFNNAIINYRCVKIVKAGNAVQFPIRIF